MLVGNCFDVLLWNIYFYFVFDVFFIDRCKNLFKVIFIELKLILRLVVDVGIVNFKIFDML